MSNTNPNNGFTASCLQIKRAYEAHFHRQMPKDLNFVAAALQIIAALGADKGRKFILSQTNDTALAA